MPGFTGKPTAALLLAALLIFGPLQSHATGAPLVDLDVDANRDAIIDDADEALEDTWSATHGALYLVNYDDDDQNGRSDSLEMDEQSGEPINVDDRINGAADAQDLAQMVVTIPAGLAIDSVVLRSLDGDMKAVHVYSEIADGARAIWGGPSETADSVDLTSVVGTGTTILGLEGLFYSWTRPNAYGGTFPNGFDGVVELRLEVTFVGGAVATDDVVLTAAPFIMLPNTQDAEQVFEMVAGRMIPGSTGYSGGERWTQDHVEIGYSQVPGKDPMTVVFRLPYERLPGDNLPSWPQELVLGPNKATFLLEYALGGGSGDYGGNIELMPPTASHPLGRIIVGNTISNDLFRFFEDQLVQTPFPKNTVDTNWLAVGHIDEIFGFIGDGAGGFVVNYADPQGAYDILNSPVHDFSDDALFFAPGQTSAGANLQVSAAYWDGVDADLGGADFGYATYMRIYDGTGAGQIAEVTDIIGDSIYIDRVWRPVTPEDLQAALGPAGGLASIFVDCADPCTDYVSVSSPTWFTMPDQTSRFVLFEDTKWWYPSALWINPEELTDNLLRSMPAAITVKEVLESTQLGTVNDAAIAAVQGSIARIQQEMGAEAPVFKGLPDLFLSLYPDGDDRYAVAMTPGAVNYQPVGGIAYVPAAFGPTDAHGVDAIEEAILANIPSQVTLVDDWDEYHRLLGEVHCGTNVIRAPYAFDWWS